MKARKSKLDPFAERLDEWLAPQDKGGDGLTLEQACAQLRQDGCSVSKSRLGEWWEARQRMRQQELLLGQIATGARQCAELDRAFETSPAPELQQIIALLKVLVMKLSTQANVDPSMFELVGYLMKPVMEWAKLQEQREDREFEQVKFKEATRKKIDLALDELATILKGHPDLMEEYQSWRTKLSERIK